MIGMLLLFHGHRRREKMSQVLHKQCQRSVTKRFSLSYIIVHYPVTSLGEVNESICARHGSKFQVKSGKETIVVPNLPFGIRSPAFVRDCFQKGTLK